MSSHPLRVLHLEDKPLDSSLVERNLRQAGYLVELERVETAEAFRASLDERLDVILLDHDLPGLDSVEALSIVRELDIRVPIIVVSGVLTEEAAVSTLKQGASNFVLKDRLVRLAPAIEQALRERDLRAVASRERRARRRSEGLASSVLSSLHQQIAVITSEGVIRHANHAWRYFARDSDARLVIFEEPGSNYLAACRDAAHAGEGVAAEVQKGIHEVLRGERRSFRLEYSHRSETNERWFVLTATLVRNADGVVIVHEEITEARAYLSTIEEKERRLSALFNNSLDAILLTDDSGRYVDANPAALRMLGYEYDELVRLNVWDVVPPADKEQTKAVWKSFTEAGSMEGEITLQRSDGNEVEVAFQATASILPGLHLSILRDVMQRKRIERQFIEAGHRAEAGTRFKSTLLANLSHETRTPLTGIIGFADILESELKGDIQSYAQQIGTNGRRLLDTLDGLIELARIEAEDRIISPEKLDLFAVAERAIESHADLAEAKDIEVILRPASEPIAVHADKSAIDYVLRQLIGNALKFTEKGTVNVALASDPSCAEIRVIDSGVGIAEEFLPELFSGFRQESHGDRRQYEGTGVGLAVSRYLVELMGGEIRVQSIKHQGSIFTVNLPLAPEYELEAKTIAPSSRARVKVVEKG